jgi:hypothetical protein
MSFKDFVGNSTEGTGIIGILSNSIIPVIIALAGLYFVWGIINYFFFQASSDEARAKGRAFALWGILGFVALFSVWGFVNIVIDTLGIGS